jgi:hypothetical protein
MSDNIFIDNDDPIENKKKENADGGKKMNFKKFAITFFGHFFITICFFTVVIGALGLYTAKVAKSNILPINPEFAPYTATDYLMGESNKAAPVLMNIVKGRSWKGFNFFEQPTGINAQKATFIKEDFNENGVFGFFCKIKAFSEQNENFSRMTFFFRKLFINGILSSFDMVNTLYSFLYSFPEWLLMLIYFTILPFIFIFLICWNAFKILLEAISNIVIPFRVNNPKVNTNRNAAGINFKHYETDDDDPTSQWWRKWSECEIKTYTDLHKGVWGTITEFMDYIGYGIMFMIYAMITFHVIIPISIFVTIFSLFNPLLRKYTLQGDNESTGKENGFGDFLRDTFAYKKTFIIVLAAYNLIMSTGMYLEKGYTFSCFVGILILALYFEVFSIPDANKIFADDSTQIIINGELPTFIKVIQISNSKNSFEKCKEKPEPIEVKEPVKESEKKPDENTTDTQLSKGNLLPKKDSKNPNEIQQYQQPIFVNPLLRKGGAKRNKNGLLHKKYNFSLV